LIPESTLDDLLARAGTPMFYAGSREMVPLIIERDTIRELVQEIKDRHYIEKHPAKNEGVWLRIYDSCE
jgi:hypothetical protein